MAKFTPLTTGCLSVIMKGTESDIEEPVLQVLGAKRIVSGGATGTERYRLLLSDGQYLQSFSMLATQLNDLVINGDLADNCIIRVKQYITSVVNKSDKDEKRVLIVLQLDVLHKGDEVGCRLGNPVNLDTKAAATNGNSSTSTGVSNRVSNGTPSAAKPVIQKDFSRNTSAVNLNESIVNGRLTTKICSLTPYQNVWVIKARVVVKSGIRTWSNAKGEGKLFSMDLMDESGDIRCTGFREAVDKFYDFIEVDKVYYISKCQLKPANKQFTSIKHNYEMTINNDAIIEECLDTADIPEVQYEFVPIQSISSQDDKANIDVIGVCREFGDLQTFNARATGRELKKRELTLVDNSDAAVTLTLWGNDAESFNDLSQPVIMVKGARITEFNGGRSVTLGASSSMKINPDIPQGHILRGWFDNGGGSSATNVSARTGAGGSGNFNTEWMLFNEATAKNLGEGDRPDYFQLKAYVNLIRTNNAIYKACPQPECNKKVIDQENGQYRCEKCNSEFPNFKYRLMMSMNIGDWNANRWANCFNETAEKILGRTADEIGHLMEENKEEVDRVLASIHFSSFLFKLRCKNEIFGDQARNKLTVQSVGPVVYKDYNQYLIKSIQDLTAISILEKR